MSLSAPKWRFHEDRDRLLAEAHARPSTPVAAPMTASRIASLSGEQGVEADRAHMALLCRKVGAPEPAADARWFMLEAGTFRLRWERHTEVSTWTVFRPAVGEDPSTFRERAIDVVPGDWLAALPGDVLVAAHAAVVADPPSTLVFAEEDLVAGAVAQGAVQVFSDFRQGPDGFTRFVLVQDAGGPVLAGRIVQQLFEVETYRLLALLAFPVATSSAGPIGVMEAQADEAAHEVLKEGGVDVDRVLISKLAALAGRVEAFAGGVSFRFAASRAYHGLVLERIAQLNETAILGRPTIGEFMERRLAPAMRTCEARAERLRDLVARIDRTTRLLTARVEVESEAANVSLLASMDRRASLQLRLQETVEGLSVVAISYYALGVLKLLFEGAAEVFKGFNPIIALGLCAPVVVYCVWRFLNGVRAHILRSDKRAGHA